MGLYEEICSRNIMPTIRQLGYKIDFRGKVPLKMVMEQQSPWIGNSAIADRDCYLWSRVFFNHFNFIPWQCMECWKIFYPPKTLKVLMRIYELQQAGDGTGMSSKCGIETRGWTARKGGYATFWYNPLGCGLEEARKNLEKVKELLGKLNGVSVKDILLKRGCTEMEHYSRNRFHLGSDYWEKLKTEKVRELQERLEGIFEIDYSEFAHELPQVLKDDIIQQWIEWAMEHSKSTGDETYKEFADEPLIPGLVFYGGSIHRAQDFPPVEEYNGTDNSGNLIEAID